jgi:hypothetical protein
VSVVEDRYFASYIESVRIVNVNTNAWSVDAISVFGNKRFFDIQVSTPYFHYMNGEGICVMPEVGAMAWICRPSSGKFGAPFILGFQAPFDENNVSFRNGRQSLNPGDIMMRTRDENFLILRRGGVVQLGATPTCQTMYVPIRNMMRHFCENYELNTFGGEMTWFVDRTDQTTDGSAPTLFSLKAREKANDPEHIASISVGSHGKDDATVLRITVKESGQKNAVAMVDLSIGKDGSVSWDVQKSMSLTVKENYSLETTTGDISFTSGKDFKATSKGNTELISVGNTKITATGTAELGGAAGTIIGGSIVKIGGPGAKYQMVRGAGPGDTLTPFLIKLLTMLGTETLSAAPGSPVVPNPVTLAELAKMIPSLVSPNTLTA